jgi:casein kinase 1
MASVRFTIEVELGQGGFGQVYLAYDHRLQRQVAVKVEATQRKEAPEADPTGVSRGQVLANSRLVHEWRMYKRLESVAMLPRVYSVGQSSFPSKAHPNKLEEYRWLTMDVLGANLEQLFDACQRRFGVRTVTNVGLFLLDALESMHRCGVLHNDLKPDNVLVRDEPDGRSRLFLVDLGLASHFMQQPPAPHDANETAGAATHIPWSQQNATLNGTARYASVNAHMGMVTSRRDDLESMLLTLAYLQRGALPWQGIQADTRADKHCEIGRIKRRTTPEQLFRSCHRNWARMLRYVRQLRFDEAPDYGRLREWLCEAARDQGVAVSADEFDPLAAHAMQWSRPHVPSVSLCLDHLVVPAPEALPTAPLASPTNVAHAAQRPPAIALPPRHTAAAPAPLPPAKPTPSAQAPATRHQALAPGAAPAAVVVSPVCRKHRTRTPAVTHRRWPRRRIMSTMPAHSTESLRFRTSRHA